MPLHSCLVCGRPSRQKHCPKHRRTGNTSWSGTRDRVAQARFRAAVLERDGNRCTYIEAGVRCAETRDLRACHIKPLREFGVNDPRAYDPSNGATLCARHDKATDSYAR